MTWLHYGIAAAVACVVTMALVPPVRKLAFKLDAVDYPGSRRVNKAPTARFGGVAMFGGLVAGLFSIWLGTQFFGWHYPLHSPVSKGVWYPGVAVGVVLIFLVGAADDIWDLRPRYKLLGQVVAASVVAASGLLLADMHNPFGPGFIDFGVAAYPITVFYLVAFMNVINLIDGLDGLASGITAISALTMFAFAVLTFRTDAAFLCAGLIGICIGFLRYNFNPASIFMGDSGSLLLGMSLGIVSLFATTRSALFVSLLVPILVAGVPIIDTASAIIRRLRAHTPIQQADNGHIHHRLLREGYSQKKTVLIMWGWTAVLAVSAIFITETHGTTRLVFMGIALGVSAFFVVRLHLLGPVLRHHYVPRPAVGHKRANEAFNKAASDLAKKRDVPPDNDPDA